MRKVIFTSIFVLILSLVSFAQEKETLPCPRVEVSGPWGLIQTGETATFTAKVSEEARNYDLEYEWEVEKAEIVDGQGTSSINVLPNGGAEDVLATVKIKGLPFKCGIISATETVGCQLEPPKSEKIKQFTYSDSAIDKSILDNFAKVLEKDPSAQAYILIGYEKGFSQESFEKKLLEVGEYLTDKKDVDKNKIFFITVPDTKNLIQLWIVPVGANEPAELKELREKGYIQQTSKSKESLPCPEGVTVDGPAGTTNPGELQTFTAKVTGGENHQLKYVWSVKGGTLVDGQGTDTVKVLQPEELIGDNLTTTVEVQSLSKDCGTVSGSEAAVTYCPIDSFIVDEISSSTLDKERITYFALALQNAPNASGHILGKFKKGTSESLLKDELRKMVIFLVKERDIDESNITIKTVETDEETTIQFWIVPAGAETPTP